MLLFPPENSKIKYYLLGVTHFTKKKNNQGNAKKPNTRTPNQPNKNPATPNKNNPALIL